MRELPQTIRQLLFTVKRYYQPEWGDNWREHFTVDRINGFLGHELKFDNQKLVSNYLRVGFDPDGSWRIYKLRPDFHPADKVQVEDDITASVVLPRESLNDLDPEISESQRQAGGELRAAMLFQRPDDAIHRGADTPGGSRHRQPGQFLFELRGAYDAEQARALVEHVAEFDRVHRADEAAAGELSAKGRTARITWSRRRIRAWSNGKRRRRIRAICRSGPIW